MIDREQLVKAAPAAVEILRAWPETEAVADWLAKVVEAGFTRQAVAEITPPAPRGGAHGRDDQVHYSRRVLTRLRECEFRHKSPRGAAVAICDALTHYLHSGFERNSRLGVFPSPDKMEYQLHDLILNGAVVKSGSVVDWETIARRFISPQMEMPL